MSQKQKMAISSSDYQIIQIIVTLKTKNEKDECPPNFGQKKYQLRFN